MTAADIKFIEVDSKNTLNILEADNAFTIEGFMMNDDEYNDMIKWFEQYCKLASLEIYHITGKFMNESYKLTGLNAYQDNLNIIAIMLSDLTFKSPEAFGKFCIDRLAVGARWFNDITYNNNLRERKQIGDYDSGEDRLFV